MVVFVTNVRLDVPDTSTNEELATVVVIVTEDRVNPSPAEPATKADSVKLVSSSSSILKLLGLTRLSLDVRRDEKKR